MLVDNNDVDDEDDGDGDNESEGLDLFLFLILLPTGSLFCVVVVVVVVLLPLYEDCSSVRSLTTTPFSSFLVVGCNGLFAGVLVLDDGIRS